MAKKTDKHELGNVDLEDIDLGLDIDAGEVPADDRDPVVRTATGFLTGLRDAVTDPNVIRKSVLAALPREYEEAYRTLDSAGNQSARLYHQVSKDLKPAVRDFKRAARQAKGLLEPVLSKSLSDKIDQWLKAEPEYKRSEINAQESAINVELAGIFKQQAEAQEEARAGQMVGEQLSDKRHQESVSLTDEIRRSLSKLVAYQDSITISYQRKSLELQFRQLYAAKDQLELARGYTAESLTLLRDITKNTALPDQVKVRGTEILGQLMQENLYGKVQESLVQTTGSFMNQLFKNITREGMDFAGGIKDGLTGATDMLDQTNMIDPSMLEDVDGYETGGRFAGQQAGEWAANKFGKWVKGTRLGQSDRVKKFGNFLGRTNQSIPDMARDWSKSPTEDMGIKGAFTDLAKSLVPRQPGKQTIGLESLDNTALPVPFDKGTRRSIMDIIPGYLARILQSSERARLQTEDVPLVKFDQTRQEFVGAGVAGSRILAKLLPKSTMDSLSYDSDRFITKVLGEIEDPELRKKLQTELISRSMSGRGFVDKDFTDAGKYKTLDKDEAVKAAALFEKAFSQEGDTTDSNLTQATTLFRRLRQSVPLVENNANAFANTGSLDLLRELGVITRSGNRDVVDDNFITSLMKDYIGSNGDYGHATGQSGGDSTVPSGDDSARRRAMRNRRMLGKFRRSAKSGLQSLRESIPSFQTLGNTFSATGISNAKDSLSNLSQRLKDNVAGTGARLGQAVRDLYVAGEHSPRLLAHLLSMGAYFSAKTREPIYSVDDIDGDVLDQNGNVVLRATEATAGLIDSAGEEFSLQVEVAPPPQPRERFNAFTAAQQTEAPLGSEQPKYSQFDQTQLNAELDRVIRAIEEGSSKPEAIAANEVLSQILEAIQTLELQGGGGPGNDQAIIRKSAIVRGIGNVGKFAWKRAGEVYKAGAWVRNKTLGLGFKGAKLGLGALGGLGKWAGRKIVEDVYTKANTSEPALFAYKMKAGHYRNSPSGKAIKNISDIKGAVFDTTTNTHVLSLEDFQSGLVDAQGKELVRSGVGWLAGKLGWAGGILGSTTWKSMTLPFKVLSAANWARRHILMRPSDVYVPGEQTPRLLAMLLLNGGYFSKKTGKPIRSVGDIDGDVVDSEGNIKLSLAEFAAGVVDSRGKPIRTVAGKIKGLLSAGVDLGVGALKFGARQVGRSFAMVGKVLGGAAKVVTGMAPNVHFGGKFNGDGGQSTDVLIKIHNLLCRHFGEEDQVIDPEASGGGGGFSKVKQFGSSMKQKAGAVKDKAVDVATNVTNKLRSVFASALGKEESDLDGKETMWERMRNRAKSFRAGSAADINAKRAAKGGMTVDKDGKPVPEQKSMTGKILAVIMGIGGLLKSAVGKLTGLLTGFWGLRKVIMAATAAKAGADALGSLGDLAGGADIDVEGRDGKKKPGRASKWGGRLKGAGRGLLTGARNLATSQGVRAAGTFAARGAVMAGGALMSGTAAAAGGLLTGTGAVLGALFSAPVLIGLGVAAVGYGAYKGYRHLKGNVGPLERARFAQYGANPDTNEQCLLLKEFEALVMPFVTFKGEEANIEGEIDYVSWMEHFGFDPETASHREVWGEWYQNRFKPVFLRWLKLVQLTDPAAKLTTLDDSLDDSLKSQFIRKTKFSRRDISPYPYDVTACPFLGTSSVDDRVVNAEIMAVWERYKKDENTKKVNGMVTTTEGGTTTVTSAMGAVPKARDDSKSITMGGQLKYISQGQADASPIVKRSSEISDFSNGRSRIVDDLTALRMKTYGLTDLDVAKVNLLLDLEDSVIKELKIQPSGKAAFEESPIRYYEEYAGKFGLAESDTEQQAIWQLWFVQRFIPVVLNYVAAVRRADKTVDFGSAGQRLSPSLLVEIAEAIRSTKADAQGRAVSVWNVNASPFVDYPVNTDPGSVRGYYLSLQNRTTSLSYKDPTPFRKESSVTGKDGTAAKLGMTLPKYSGVDMPITQAQREAASPKPVYKDLVSSTPFMVSGSGNGGTGTYAEIPRPKGNGSWNAFKDTITAAAAAVGVDPAALASMAHIESTFNSDAFNSTTGATGLFQFLGSTWSDMLKDYGPKYGVPADAKPTDPVASALFAASYMKWNADRISAKVSRPLSATDLYAAHFLGHANAVKLLKADPNAEAASVFPGPARTNQAVFYKGGRAITIAELYKWLDDKVSGKIPSGMALAGSGAPRGETSVLEANGLADPNRTVGNVGGMTQEERDQSKAQSTTTSTAMKTSTKVPSVTLASSYANSAPKATPASMVVSNTGAQPQESPAERDARITADLQLRNQRNQHQQVELAKVNAAKSGSQLTILQDSLKVQIAMDEKLGDIKKAILSMLQERPQEKPSKTTQPQTAAAPTTTRNPQRPDYPVSLNRHV